MAPSVHSSKRQIQRKTAAELQTEDMDSALLPWRDSDENNDTISIVAYGTSPQSPTESTRPAVDSRNRNSWRSSPPHTRTSLEPPDWSSDVGARVDGSARRIAVNGGTVASTEGTTVTQGSVSSMPSTRGENSFRSTSGPNQDTTVSVKSSELPTTPPGDTTVHPLTLYGKNILRIVPIGSTEPSGRDFSPITWSDTLGAVDTEDDFSIRDPHFDLTTGKISKLFSLSNPNEDGMLSFEGFRCGLEAMGINCSSDAQFQAFVDEVDDNKSGDISYDEFLCAIQEIKLAQLFNDNFIRTMPQLNARSAPAKLGSIEYSPDRIRSVYPINQEKSFIYSTKPDWATVRWINVEGINTLLMRRLSVRYRLHPLAIEDTLGPDVKRPKYVKFDEHSSLILQTLHPRDYSTVKAYQNMYRASQFVLPEDESPFDSMTKADLESMLAKLNVGHVMCPPTQLSLYVMEGVLISVQASGANTLWPTLRKRLHVSYSKTFGAKLLMLERLMSMDHRYFDLSRIAACEKQIKGLQMHCKPMREVISKLVTSDDYQGETLQYLADVQEHLTTIEAECEQHLDRCNSLVEGFNNERASQQNDVSYILALIAAIFLPAQFLTGVYGMNFPYIPEQTYHNGYFVWWAVMIIVAGLIVLFFKCKRWL
ncbi:hypothetical protein PHYBOEH_001834 [Phytophthora boehmeriae]|uniref:EF-hand domain-containing protein n=1 Tax=Phytophthora boehmeriae TaxID=109152 RepID=A0A8T1WX11_9STRA|nr:hypothetical protein PHYBOEH_001834 [Phytophthora boehmeriae]